MVHFDKPINFFNPIKIISSLSYNIKWFWFISARDVFKLLTTKYKKDGLSVGASFFEIYSGKVSCDKEDSNIMSDMYFFDFMK